MDESLSAVLDERTKRMAVDIAEMKTAMRESFAEVKDGMNKLMAVGSDHEKRIALIEVQLQQDRKNSETNSDTVKKIVLPLVTTFLSGGIGATVVVVAQHLINP